MGNFEGIFWKKGTFFQTEKHEKITFVIFRSDILHWLTGLALYIIKVEKFQKLFFYPNV